MPNFACPKCKKVLKTSTPIAAGKKVKCPACTHVFPVPAQASADKSAIQDNKPDAPARKPAVMPSSEGAAKRHRPDGDSVRDDAPKARARADIEEPDDEGEDEPRSARRRGKKKKDSKRGLLVILSGVGLLVLLVLIAAFIWPGFLLGGKAAVKTVTKGKVAGVLDPLAFVPNPTELVAGANLAFLRTKPEEMQQLEQVLRQQAGMSNEQIGFLKSVDRGIIAGGELGSGGTFVLAFTTLKPTDPDTVRTTFKAGPAEMLQGKAVYKLGGIPGKEHMAMADDKTIVVSTMPKAEFVKVLDGNGKLSPDMQAQVNSVGQKSLWAVVNLQGVLKDKMNQVDALKDMPGGAEAAPALKNAKLATISIDQLNDTQLQIDIQCANDQDATQVETFAKNLWEQKGKPNLLLLPLLMGNQPGGEGIQALVDEVSKGVQIQRQGALVSASLTISENTLKALDKLRPAGAGNPAGVNPEGLKRPSLKGKKKG